MYYFLHWYNFGITFCGFEQCQAVQELQAACLCLGKAVNHNLLLDIPVSQVLRGLRGKYHEKLVCLGVYTFCLESASNILLEIDIDNGHQPQND